MARPSAKKGKGSAARKTSDETPMPSQRETRRTRRSASVESVELASASQPTRGGRTRTTRSTSQDPASKDPKNSLFNMPDPPDVKKRRSKRVASRASSAAPTVSDVDPDEHNAEDQEEDHEIELEAAPEAIITEHSTITTTQDTTSFTTTQDTIVASSAQFDSGNVTYPNISDQIIENASSSTGFAQSVEVFAQNNIYDYDVHELSTVPEESPFESEFAGDAMSPEELDQHQLDQQVLGDARKSAEATESYGSATSEPSGLSHDPDASMEGEGDRTFYNNREGEVIDLATDEEDDSDEYPEDDSDGNRYQPEESDLEDFIPERPTTSISLHHDDIIDGESDEDEEDEAEHPSAGLYADDGESPVEIVDETTERDSELEVIEVAQAPTQIDDSVDSDDDETTPSAFAPQFVRTTPSVHAAQFGRAAQSDLASPFAFATPSVPATQYVSATNSIQFDPTTQSRSAVRDTPEIIDLGDDDEEEKSYDAESAPSNNQFAQTAQEPPSSSPNLDTHMEDSSSFNSTSLLNNHLKQILRPLSPASLFDISAGQVRSIPTGLPSSSLTGQLPSSPFNPDFTSTPRNYASQKDTPIPKSRLEVQMGWESQGLSPFRPWSDIDRLCGHDVTEKSLPTQPQHDSQSAPVYVSNQDHPPSPIPSQPQSESQSQSEPGHESEVGQTFPPSTEYKYKYECSIEAYEASLDDSKLRDAPDYSTIPKPMSHAEYGTMIARRMKRSVTRRRHNPTPPTPTSAVPHSVSHDPQEDKHEQENALLRKKIEQMEQLFETNLNRISELEAQNTKLAAERDQFAAKAEAANRKYRKSRGLPEEQEEASEFEERALEVARLREEQQIRDRNFAARANLMAMETSTTAEVILSFYHAAKQREIESY
jgi:hypothetical protein